MKESVGEREENWRTAHTSSDGFNVVSVQPIAHALLDLSSFELIPAFLQCGVTRQRVLETTEGSATLDGVPQAVLQMVVLNPADETLHIAIVVVWCTRVNGDNARTLRLLHYVAL